MKQSSLIAECLLAGAIVWTIVATPLSLVFIVGSALLQGTGGLMLGLVLAFVPPPALVVSSFLMDWRRFKNELRQTNLQDDRSE